MVRQATPAYLAEHTLFLEFISPPTTSLSLSQKLFSARKKSRSKSKPQRCWSSNYCRVTRKGRNSRPSPSRTSSRSCSEAGLPRFQMQDARFPEPGGRGFRGRGLTLQAQSAPEGNSRSRRFGVTATKYMWNKYLEGRAREGNLCERFPSRLVYEYLTDSYN